MNRDVIEGIDRKSESWRAARALAVDYYRGYPAEFEHPASRAQGFADGVEAAIRLMAGES